MKLKSYLRGLGLGMIVTTLILVLAFRARNKEMTDEEIIARAQELGMVETSLYGSNTSNEEETTVKQENETTPQETSGEGMIDPEGTSEPETPSEMETPSETEPTKEVETTSATEATKEVETTSAPEPTKEPQTEKTTEKPTEKETEKETETQKPQETKPENEVITLIFEDISSADKASKILYDAGIIQSVENFNAYLSEQGLATKVGEGEFQFKKGMTFEEIANIITRRQAN